jgi:hypothetical protein
MHHLFSGVEKVLASMQVEKLVIPAIASLLYTRMRSFSFRPMYPQLRQELKRVSVVTHRHTHIHIVTHMHTHMNMCSVDP